MSKDPIEQRINAFIAAHQEDVFLSMRRFMVSFGIGYVQDSAGKELGFGIKLGFFNETGFRAFEAVLADPQSSHREGFSESFLAGLQTFAIGMSVNGVTRTYSHAMMLT